MAKQKGKIWKLNPFSKMPLIQQAIIMRQQRQQDTIIIIVGEKRSGKSYGAIKMAELINPNFDAEKQVFFHPKDFVRFMQTAQDDVCILDEASVYMSNRDWYDVQNKIMNQILMTQGFRRNVIIMTFPTLSHLDKQALDFCHYIITTLRLGLVKCFRVKVSQFSKKMFPLGFELLNLSLPTEANINKYELLKQMWNDMKLQEDMDYFEALENRENFTKKFNFSDYTRAFKNGFMSQEAFRERLSQMGYSPKDINMMINMETTLKEQKGQVTQTLI
ncbi:hypothetical protein KKC87_04540 [Patescibacteria group bacterium]|nr:hypothetical protein [Patescibacteria group bacterium]